MTDAVAVAEEYDFPADLAEAERAYQDLVFEVQDIQEQLGNKNRTDPEGNRISDVDYWEWRNRAAGALRHRLDELRALKNHVKELRRETVGQRTVTEGGLSPMRAVDALVLAYREGRVDDVARHLVDLAATWDTR